MVDDKMSLTFSVRNNPGRYALLIGSGVSTGAGIPTGWAVVEDLLGKLVVARGGDEPDDLFEWYRNEYDEEARYDDIIGELADSKEERRALLEDYFEPSDEEREAGDKTPTDAHRAIAWLVDNDYVNVVITTNFDRLLERAMEERGVTPVTVTGAESAEGAEPLAHQDAIVVKVNGDYKETDIRNLASELEEYPDPLQEIVDEAFRKYGLIVSGWSAKWDDRLRESLRSCETHRYSTYWSHRSGLSEEAEQLVEQRSGNRIQIEGAAPFFSELKERVQALEGAESGAPLTREVVRERVKRYLPRGERGIDLADLLKNETEQVHKEVFDQERFPIADLPDDFEPISRLEDYEPVLETLCIAAITCGYWGQDTVNTGIAPVKRSVERLGSTPNVNRYNRMADRLRRYPASLVMYGAGTAAVNSGHWDMVYALLGEATVRPHRHGASSGRNTERPAAIDLHPWRVGAGFGSRPSTAGFVGGPSGGNQVRTEIKEALEELLRTPIPDYREYEKSFERFEILSDMALVHYQSRRGQEIEHLSPTYWQEALSDMADDFQNELDEWGPVRAGLFESSSERAARMMDELQEVVR